LLKSLVLFIFNLVLAAPIVMQEIHEACVGDEMNVAEGVAAMPKKGRDLNAAPDRFMSRASRQHSPSLDGSTSFGLSCIAFAVGFVGLRPFVPVGRVDVFGLSSPIFVVGSVGLRQFVVVA
jgi:hypothetical protein